MPFNQSQVEGQKLGDGAKEAVFGLHSLGKVVVLATIANSAGTTTIVPDVKVPYGYRLDLVHIAMQNSAAAWTGGTITVQDRGASPTAFLTVTAATAFSGSTSEAFATSTGVSRGTAYYTHGAAGAGCDVVVASPAGGGPVTLKAEFNLVRF